MKTVLLLCLFGLFAALKASEEYTCYWYTGVSDTLLTGWRIDEGTSEDCEDPQDPGGQCVALLKCTCGMPYTGCWQASRKVSDYCRNSSSVEAIARGTPIATFDSLTARYRGHAAIFDSCDGENIKVFDQWCNSSLKISTYTPIKKYYPKYYTITKRATESNCKPYPSKLCKFRSALMAETCAALEKHFFVNWETCYDDYPFIFDVLYRSPGSLED